MRHPNIFQAFALLLGTISGGVIGTQYRVNDGHSGLLLVIFGAIAGALLSLLVSGTVLMIFGWTKSKDDEQS